MTDEQFKVLAYGIVLIALHICCLILLIGRIKYGGARMTPGTPAAYIDHTRFKPAKSKNNHKQT